MTDGKFHQVAITYQGGRQGGLMEAHVDGRLVLRKHQPTGAVDMNEILDAAQLGHVVDDTHVNGHPILAFDHPIFRSPQLKYHRQGKPWTS